MKKIGVLGRFRSLFSSRVSKSSPIWYNTPINRDRSDYIVDSDRSKNDDGYDGLGFLFRACSCKNISMKMWLETPEFKEKVGIMLKQGIRPCDETILPIMQEVYDKKLEEKREARKQGLWFEFDFHKAKSGMRMMRRAIDSKNVSSADS